MEGFQQVLMQKPMLPCSILRATVQNGWVFYSSSKHKNMVQFSTSAQIVRAKTQRPYRKSGGRSAMPICGPAHANHCVNVFFLFCRFTCQALITVHQNSGWSFWLAFCFPPSPIHHTENQGFSFFFSTVRDWHRAEMQNNNPLITWVLPVLGFICNGCESPQCLVITAFDLGNNVFTVALLRARRQCSFNPQCILVESHYTKTTRVLL